MLIDSYNAKDKEKNGIDDWDEEAFEREEKRLERAEALNLQDRNLMEGGRASTATIEYMQQYGIQLPSRTCRSTRYMNNVTDRMNKGIMLHANDLEDFLDGLADKYWTGADTTTERIYGKKDNSILTI